MIKEIVCLPSVISCVARVEVTSLSVLLQVELIMELPLANPKWLLLSNSRNLIHNCGEIYDTTFFLLGFRVVRSLHPVMSFEASLKFIFQKTFAREEKLLHKL